MIYAIIRAGGKQYRVQPEQTLDVDRLAAESGALVEFQEVLLVSGDGGVQLGNPFVEGARVVAEVLDQGRGKKILVFKYKNKTRYRRRHGHRQAYTRLSIREILTDGRAGGTPDEAKPGRAERKRAAPKARTESEDATQASIPEAEAPADSGAEAPVTEVPTKTRRATRARKSAVEGAVGDVVEARPEGAVGGAAEAEAKPARRTKPKTND